MTHTDLLDRHLSAVNADLERVAWHRNTDPMLALLAARHACETMIIWLYEKHVGSAEGVTARELVGRLEKRRHLPKNVSTAMGTVHTYGNFAAHPNDPAPERIDVTDAAPAYAALVNVARWHFEALGVDLPIAVSGLDAHGRVPLVGWCISVVGYPSVTPKTVPVDERVSIGRGSQAWLVIPNDPKVSTSHAKLKYSYTGLQVEDDGSRNGTFLNEEPIRSSIVRRDSTLRVGETELRVARVECVPSVATLPL